MILTKICIEIVSSFVFTDWSILYVVVAIFIMFILISAICWALTCYCRTTKPRNRTKTQKYALLESQDHETPSCKLKHLLHFEYEFY